MAGAEARTPLRLPFALARDTQVLLEGARLVIGPDATTLGLREAQRRAGSLTLDLVEESRAGFETALSRVYEKGGSEESGASLGEGFDLEEVVEVIEEAIREAQ